MTDILNNLEGLDPIQSAFVLAAIEVVGDYNAKQQNTGSALVAYNALCLTLTKVLKNNGLAVTNLWWNAITNIANTLIGMSMGEKLTQTQIIGAVLITTGIWLLNR